MDWINTIETLPDCYTDKDIVLRKLGKYSLLETEQSLLQKRVDGVYDEKIFNQYRNVLTKCCDIPLDIFRKIALMTPEQAVGEKKNRMQK